MFKKTSTYLLSLLAIFILSSLFSCSDDKASSPSATNVTDVDGNVYPIVTIGSQVWMAQNLKVNHYRNGDTIPNVIANNDWDSLTIGACCIYNTNSNLVSTYGSLYNWYAVTDNRNIAPVGWHIATDAEWQTLIDYLGGTDVAGGKLKEAGYDHWLNPNTGATNESGFSALPGGEREGNGTYGYMGVDGYFWSSTEFDSSRAWYRPLRAGSSVITRNYGGKDFAFSIRCVKN
jgi:uncharacterized protein (TIGR02145 family)